MVSTASRVGTGNIIAVATALCMGGFGSVFWMWLIALIGAGLSADLLWDIADITMGCMTIINMPIIIYLGKYAIRALKDYEKQIKTGSSVAFKAKDIGLPHKTDYWN